MKLVLAIDDSKCSEAAINVLIQSVRAADTKVCILHAVEPMWLVLDYETGELGQIQAAREESMMRGKNLLEKVEPMVAGAGFSVTTALEEGDPRFVIVDYASQWKADLILLGSHGRRGLGRLLLGSVAEHVARHAHCSVMIVRPKSA